MSRWIRVITDLELEMEQVKATTTTVFEAILGPLLPLLREQCAQLRNDANTYKLSLEPFVVNLVFATLNNIKSISLLVTEIDSSVVAREIGLIKVSKSMYSEAFARYSAQIFQNLFFVLPVSRFWQKMVDVNLTPSRTFLSTLEPWTVARKTETIRRGYELARPQGV